MSVVAGALAVVFFAVLLGQVEHSVFGRVPLLDEVYYLDRAADVTAGHPIPDEPYFMSPLYPVLIAAAGGGGGMPADRVFDGPRLRGLRRLQIGFWLGTLALIHLLSRQVVPVQWRGRRRTAAIWLPVVLFALYRPALVYAMAVLLESALLFVTTLAIYLMARAGRPESRAVTALGLGVVLGLAVLLRGTALLLVPVGLVALLRRRTLRGGVRAGALLLLGVVVVLALPVIHNSRLAGRLVGPTLNGGVNLYIGNGPEANGFYVAAVPGDWRHDPAGRKFLARRLGRPEVSLAEADRIWAGEAWRTMREDPVRVLGLGIRKVWLQLQGWEIDQLTPLAGWRDSVPLLRPLVVPYALLVVLGLAGWSGSGRRSTATLLGLALAVLLLGQSMFFIVSRYRLVLVPIWSVLAGVGAVRLGTRNRSAWLVAVAAAVLIVPWGLNGVRTSWTALAEANEALRWAEMDAADAAPAARQRAESLYRQSLAAQPNRVASWLGLAAVVRADGRVAEEATVLHEGLSRVDDPLPLQKALLANELARGEAASAEARARTILTAQPRDADTLHNLSVLLARAGRTAEALATARKLRQVQPDDPRGYIDVGVLLARSGRRQEARRVFQAGLERCPGNPDLTHNLSLVID